MQVTKWPAQTRAGEAYATEIGRASLTVVLLEAVLWASSRADSQNPTRSLRSAALAPYVFNDSRHDTVFDVVSRRHRELELEKRVTRLGGRWDELVDAQSIGLGDLQPVLTTGRLLVWARDSTIDDGVGQAETKGYLDESDMPPWDTWVAYVDPHPEAGYLVSWVPEPFVATVGRAIELNAYAALHWLRDSGLPVAEVLRSEGLLV